MRISRIGIQGADMRRTIAMAAMLGILGTAFIALPARADDDGDDWHGHQRQEWQENHWREHEWHERAEAREQWRHEHAWRNPYYYATPPVNGYYNGYYYSPPPVVTYAPQPYYAPPGVSFYFGPN